MSCFSDYLKSCMQKNGIGAADLARLSSLERTQVHRYATGSRTPSDLQIVDALANALRLSILEREEFYHRYELTMLGDTTYEGLMLVKEILEGLEQEMKFIREEDYFAKGKVLDSRNNFFDNKELSENYIKLDGHWSVLEAVQFVFEEMQSEEEKNVSLILQPEYSSVNERIIYFSHKYPDIHIEHIICMNKNADMYINKNLEILNEILPLFFSKVDYSVYYYYNTISEHINTMTLMPNVIITSAFLLMFDYEMDKGILVRDEFLLSYYRDEFFRMREKCSMFSTAWNNLFDIIWHCEMVQNMKYNIHVMPCLAKCLTREIYEQYFYDFIPDRAEFIEQLALVNGDWKNNKFVADVHFVNGEICIFKKEGLYQFLETGYIDECPTEVYAPFSPKDRLEILQRIPLLVEQGVLEYRLLKDEIKFPENLIINVGEEYGLLQFQQAGDFGQSHFEIKEKSISQSFSMYIKYLLDYRYAYSQEETLEWIREQCERYKQTLEE